MNIVILTGRLAADPEVKYTQSGKAMAKFTLAVAREYNKNDADFVHCVAWDKRAEIVERYLKKGNMTGVQGRIVVRTYDDLKGQKHRITEVNVDNIEFLDSKKTSEHSISKPSASTENAIDVEDDEFPF